MKKFELPKMEIHSFDVENIVTQSGVIETTAAMQTWAETNDGEIITVDHTKLMNFVF